MAVKNTTFQQVAIKVEPYLDKKGLQHGDKPMSVDDSDVIVIFSDSESEKQSRVPVKKEGFKVKLEEPATAIKAKGKACNRAIPVVKTNSTAAFDRESETVWTDSEITSFVIEGKLQVTAELWVKRVEYLSEIPYAFPIPKVPTAFIVDLQDEKFLIPKSESDPTP